MSARSASRTALAVAALRAYHQLYDGLPKILDDPIAPKIVPSTSIVRVAASRNAWSEALRLHVVMRSRYAEDRLAEAVLRGVRQVVILGAGYDTFAYRQPPWARDLQIFEVDQPASQAAKRERLAAAGIPLPDNVRFVPIDFERTSLSEGMREGGFDAAKPAFFSWLGVMMYLDMAAVDAVFAYVASLPPRSEIAFTYARPGRLFAPEAPIAMAAAAVGEPWKTRLSARSLEARLRAHGFEHVDFLDAQTANARYQPTRCGLPPVVRISIGAALRTQD